MLTPSIFGENLFDDWFDDFPFFDDRDLRKVDKKLYGRRAGNLMKTDIQEMKDGYKMEVDLPDALMDEPYLCAWFIREFSYWLLQYVDDYCKLSQDE